MCVHKKFFRYLVLSVYSLLLAYIAVVLTVLVGYIVTVETRFNDRDISRVEDAATWFTADTCGMALRVCQGAPYATDSEHVYYIGDSISTIYGADPVTFKYMGQGFAADSRNMYYDGHRIMWDNELLDPTVRQAALTEAQIDSVPYLYIPVFRFRFIGSTNLPSMRLYKIHLDELFK